MSNQVTGKGRRRGQHHIDLTASDDLQAARDGVSEPADLVVWKAEEVGRGCAAPSPPTVFVSRRRVSPTSSDSWLCVATQEPVAQAHHRGVAAPRSGSNDRYTRIGSLDE
jgi:hypothetical protein